MKALRFFRLQKKVALMDNVLAFAALIFWRKPRGTPPAH
jgi:hypothetical protein